MMRGLLRDLVTRAQRALLRAISGRRRVHGLDVWIVNDGEFATTDAMFQKLESALQLISDHVPWRLRAMGRDFTRILVVRQNGCRATFDRMGNCRLDTFFVANFTAAQVAASIVHEGVHARLRRGGCRLPPDLIAFEERLCRRAELAFGLKIPEGEAVVERARGALALSDAEIAPLADGMRLRRRRPRPHGPGPERST